MKKADSLKNKIKILTLAALFAVTFVSLAGCSGDKDPSKTEKQTNKPSLSNSISVSKDNANMEKTQASKNGVDIDQIKSEVGRLTIGHIDIPPKTQSTASGEAENPTATTASEAQEPQEATASTQPNAPGLTKSTLESNDNFVIGEDTQTTPVYGFNG